MNHMLCVPVLGMGLLLPTAVLASCGAYGVCGTIVFLGKTADRSKAVFLSTTTTRGQYDVTPTSGTFPVDTWVTSGPDTRITLSDQVATWGGTHALNYYPAEGGPIGSRVYIAGATQNPNGTVYPNDYRPPGRSTPVVAPQPLRLQVLPASTVIEQQVNQGPVTAQAVIETVAVQGPGPQVGEPVRGPTVPDTTGAAVREAGPVALVPEAHLSRTDPPAQQVLEPILVAPVVSVRQPNTGPVLAPGASGTTTFQGPQPPSQVLGPALLDPPTLSVRQPSTGPVVAPTATQTLAIQSPQVPSQVRGPTLLDPPTLSVRQPNTGPVVAPPGLQSEVVQGPLVPPMVQTPRDPEWRGGQGGELPGRPPTVTGGQRPPGTGLLPGNGTTKELPKGLLDTTQNTRVDDIPRHPGFRPARQPWVSTGYPCDRAPQHPPPDPLQQRLCDDADPPLAYDAWIDLSAARSHDNTLGLRLRQRGEGMASGLDRLIDAQVSVGVYASAQRQRGTMLDGVLQVKTAHTGAGAYATKRWGEHWQLTAGLHVGDETVSVDFFGFSGRFRTRTWTVSTGLVGTHSMGDVWWVSRINVEHLRKRTGTGAITGSWAGERLDVETPSSKDDFWATSAGIELGTQVPLAGGAVLVPSVDVGVNRVAHGSRRSNPWQVDVRLGARVQWTPVTTLMLSYHRMGLNRADYRSEEWRATLVHRF